MDIDVQQKLLSSTGKVFIYYSTNNIFIILTINTLVIVSITYKYYISYCNTLISLDLRFRVPCSVKLTLMLEPPPLLARLMYLDARAPSTTGQVNVP